MELTKHEDLTAKNQIVSITKPEEITPTVIPTTTPKVTTPTTTPFATTQSAPVVSNPTATPATQTVKGTGQTTQNVTTAPVKTGDTAVPVIWASILLVSLLVGLAALRKKYRK